MTDNDAVYIGSDVEDDGSNSVASSSVGSSGRSTKLPETPKDDSSESSFEDAIQYGGGWTQEMTGFF